MSSAAGYSVIKGQMGALISSLVPMLALIAGLFIVLFLVGLLFKNRNSREVSVPMHGMGLPGGASGLPVYSLGSAPGDATASSMRGAFRSDRQDRERRESDAKRVEVERWKAANRGGEVE